MARSEQETDPAAETAEQVDAIMLALQALVGVAAQSVTEVEDRVTLPQLRVLVLVASRGSLNLNAVAEAMEVHPSNASRSVDRLVAAGLLRRTESIKDQMTEVKAALKSVSGADSLSRQVSAIDKEIDSILKSVRGEQGAAPRDADDKNKFEPSIQDRVNQVASEIGDVTSSPTQLQRETLDAAMKDLIRI